jgi:hypothetical protein
VLVLVLVVVLDLDLWTRRATRVDFPAINLLAQCHGGLGALVADLPVLFNEAPYRSGIDPGKWYQRASGICSCSTPRIELVREPGIEAMGGTKRRFVCAVTSVSHFTVLSGAAKISKRICTEDREDHSAAKLQPQRKRRQGRTGVSACSIAG